MTSESLNRCSYTCSWSWQEIHIPVPNGFIRGKLWNNFRKREEQEDDDCCNSNDCSGAKTKDTVTVKQETCSIRESGGTEATTTKASTTALREEEGHVTTDRFIALHGWQDNCGTFDTLIPLLLPPQSTSCCSNDRNNGKDVSMTNGSSVKCTQGHRVTIAAIDLPGHGLSSHYGPGSFYTDLTFAIDLTRVVSFLGWNTFSLLGHSMGGYVSVFYASLFPDQVERVVMLDILKPLTFPPEKLSLLYATSIQSFLRIESKINQQDVKVPSYKKSDAVDRVVEAHSKYGKLSREAATILLKRGSRPVDSAPNDDDVETNESNGLKTGDDSESVVFTRDPRLHAIFFSRFDVSTVKAYLSNLKCDLFVIKADQGIKLDDDEVSEAFIKLYTSVCRTFKLIEVPGHHHVHLCDPAVVADEINRILRQVNHNDSKISESSSTCEENGKTDASRTRGHTD